MHITSLQNPRIKSILRLRMKSRERQRGGLFLVEGADEIELALAAGHQPKTVVFAPDLTRHEIASVEGESLTVTPAIFRKLSLRERPDGWMAVFQRPVTSVEDLTLSTTPLVLLMESVEKPGNLGAVLRTADAVGVDAVIVCDRRVDVYSPNVVRASRGALLSVPVVELTSAEALGYLRARRIRVVAANANAGADYQEADLKGPIAIAMGTEDTGLSTIWLDEADIQVRIPMQGKINSLNVSVAAALLLYEARRQRAT
ncbi:MAG TPA: RNA methyltransferase [Anaerolineales bacterium]